MGVKLIRLLELFTIDWGTINNLFGNLLYNKLNFVVCSSFYKPSVLDFY